MKIKIAIRRQDDDPRSSLTYRLLQCRHRELELAWSRTLAQLPPCESPSPESRQPFLQALIEIDDLLFALKPPVRAAFLSAQFEGSTIPQIATRLQVSPVAVERHLASALRHCHDQYFDTIAQPLNAAMTDAAVDDAIDWSIKSNFHSPAAEWRHAFASWLQADATHAEAWQHLQQLQSVFARVPPLLALETLHAVTRLRHGLNLQRCLWLRLLAFMVATTAAGKQWLRSCARGRAWCWTQSPLGRG